MKQLSRIASLSLIVFIISLFITTPVLAIPTLPSSFYGTVKVNGANVPDGTVVQALIGGQVCAQGFTQMYQDNSVYALDVQGYDADTAPQGGGREGDTIQFKVGGVLADQTALWHTGTNVYLNLTVSSSGTLSTPQATPTPVPTQTAIVIIQPSTVSTAIEQAWPTSTTVIQPSQTATGPAQPLPIKNMAVQPSLTPVAPEKSENAGMNGSGNIGRVLVLVITLVPATILGYAFLTLRRKRN